MLKDSILFLFDDEWGEIDNILPLILLLKKSKKMKIIVLFLNTNLVKKKKNFSNLDRILKKNADLILTPNSVPFKNLIKDKLKLKSFQNVKDLLFFFIKLIKSDNYKIKSNFFKNEICNQFNIKYICHATGAIIDNCWFNLDDKVKYLVLPHAPTFRGGSLHKYRTCDIKKYDSSRIKRYNHLKRYPNGTIFFTCDKEEKIYFKKYCPKNIKIVPIGFPRLQDDYISIIKKNKKSLKKKRQILILLGKLSYIGNNALIKKFEDILFLAEKYKFDVKFKYHPKSTFKIKHITKKFPKINIREANNNVMSEAINSMITISTSKTGSCLDSVIVGTPVIEYYSYSNHIYNNIQNEFKINGKITSLFKYYGIVKSIDNFMDLDNFIKEIDSSAKKFRKIILNQKKALSKIAHNRNSLPEKFLKSI